MEGIKYQALRYENLPPLCSQCRRTMFQSQACLFCHSPISQTTSQVLSTNQALNTTTSISNDTSLPTSELVWIPAHCHHQNRWPQVSTTRREMEPSVGNSRNSVMVRNWFGSLKQDTEFPQH